MKTFDEAVKTVHPPEITDGDVWNEFFKCHWDHVEDLKASVVLNNHCEDIALGSLEYACCQEHLVSRITSLCLACIEIGVAIGIEMEKPSLDA